MTAELAAGPFKLARSTLFALVLGLCAHVPTAPAAESPLSMLAEAEEAQNVPAGPWQGNWLVLREDPRIRSRGGAEALRLHVIHDAGSDHAQVQWVAGPAICPDPLADPCEWIGTSGESVRAPVGDGSFYLLLPISADPLEPLLLHIPSRADGAGRLLGMNSELRYRVRLIAAPTTDEQPRP